MLTSPVPAQPGGRMNLGVALRRCELRYCETSEDGPVAAEERIAMLSELIGLGAGGPGSVPGSIRPGSVPPGVARPDSARLEPAS